MLNPERTVIVSIKLIDQPSTTQFTMPRCNLNITDRYVSLKIHQTEIFRPWHQIKELKIMEVETNAEPGHRADT